MTFPELFADSFSTTLATPITSTSATTISVANPAPTTLQGGQFRILVDNEIMLVTSGQNGTTWTVVRGNNLPAPDTSTAATHLVNAPVLQELTAGAYKNGILQMAPSLLNVLAFGAQGDGVTDDTAAINAAIVAASAVNPGTITYVVCPSGFSFKSNSSINLKNGVGLWCYGAEMIPGIAGTGLPWLNTTGLASNGTLNKFEVRGGFWAGTGNEAEATGEVFMQAPQEGRVGVDIGLYDMYINNWGSSLFILSNPTRLRVMNNTIINPGLGSMSDQNPINVVLETTTTTYEGEVIITGNFVEGASAQGISIVNGGATNQPLKVIVANNVVTGGTTANNIGGINTTMSMTVSSGSTAVANIQMPNGSSPQGTGNALYLSNPSSGSFPALNKLNLVNGNNGPSTTGTLATAWTGSGTNVPITCTAVRGNAGSIAFENDTSAVMTNFIATGNDVVNVGGNAGQNQGISVGANPGGVNGQFNRAIVSNNNITAPNGAFSIFSPNNPADVILTNNRCNCNGMIMAASTGAQASVASGNSVSGGATQGTATLNGTTPVTVTTAEVITGDHIILSRTSSSAAYGEMYINSITNLTSFTIASSVIGDNGTVYWEIRH